MNRRLMPTATALAATAVLLLTACGSNDDKPAGGDKIPGVDTGTKSASPSAPTSGAAGRPEITLPKTFELQFQGWTSSDPVEQAVLNDGREQIRAGYAAIIEKDPSAGYFAFYNTESALGPGQEWIKSYTDKDLTLLGKAPVSGAQVSLLGKTRSRAALTYCMDESKAYTKNRETGKTAGTPAGTNPKVRYTTTVQKNSKGVWQTRSLESKRGKC